MGLRTPTAATLGIVAWVAAAVHPAEPNGRNPARPEVEAAQARSFPQWGSLTPGRHRVGFRLDRVYDHSRRVAPLADFEGKPNAKPVAMPMVIGVWYPAIARPGATPMQYGTFAALGARRTDFAPVTAADRRTAIDNMRDFAGFAFGRQIPEPSMRAVDTTSTAAVLDATPATGRFPVVLAETDGSIAVATVLFEYLASHGIVVIATPSQASYATLQVSRPSVVVEARVRDFEFLLDRARRYTFADTGRLAVLGVNFDGMAALAFQMKNMAARAVVSLDGWEGKEGSTRTVSGGLHYDPRRMRVPYLVVLQDEQQPPPGLRLDRTVFDAMRYADRRWLVLSGIAHAYLVGNPLVYPDVPVDKRRACEALVRGVHAFLAASLADATSASAPTIITESPSPTAARIVKEEVRVAGLPALPDDAELERLIMRDRAADKLASILREARRTDSSVVLFSEQTMALYAFRFTRQNDLRFAVRLLELNTEAFPESWTAADALGDGYRGLADTSRALGAYARAIEIVNRVPGADSAASGAAARARQAIETKVAELRLKSGSRSPSPGRATP